MPITAIELIKKLMAKAGVTHATELTADIPDEVATALDNNLLTIDSAKNNYPEIRNHYTAQVYKGVDAELSRIMIDLNLPEDVKQEIMQAGVSEEKPNGSTVKRISALTKKVRDLSDKSNPADKEATKKLNDTIVELNKKLAAEIEGKTAIQTDYDNKVQKIKVQTKLNTMLSKYNTVYDTLDPEAKEAAITALISKALQDSDADFKFDDKGNLSIVKKDGSNLFGDNHTQVTPQTFMDKTLSKILKVTTPGNGSSNNSSSAQPVLSNEQSKSNPALKAALAESLASYTEASKNGVTA